MHRRFFFGACAAVGAAALTVASLPAANRDSASGDWSGPPCSSSSCSSSGLDLSPPVRHVYLIIDGGYEWYWSEPSLAQALIEHLRLNYTEAGVELEDTDELSGCRVDDCKPLTIEGITRSCGEWANREYGIIGTDCQ